MKNQTFSGGDSTLPRHLPYWEGTPLPTTYPLRRFVRATAFDFDSNFQIASAVPVYGVVVMQAVYKLHTGRADFSLLWCLIILCAFLQCDLYLCAVESHELAELYSHLLNVVHLLLPVKLWTYCEDPASVC